MLPTIAIVGRPNVGKSTLFNRFIGKRQALVHDRPGVTRDRHYGTASWLEREFIIIDTGGFEPDTSALEEGDMFHMVRRQAEAAVTEADIVILLVDRQAGLTPSDRLTVNILRKHLGAEASKRLMLVVNKCDSNAHEDEAVEFWQLGFEEMWCISAEHGRGFYDLWDAILPRAPESADELEDLDDTAEIRIAVLGRPNIGKSTLVNRLIGEERHVVHDAPGTTMDAIDSVVQVGDRTYRLIDTAGVRRKARIDDRVETFATARAIRTIERCHLTLLVIDAIEGVTRQDARLAELVADRGRACILLLNKWDKVKEDPERNVHVVRDEIETHLPHVVWAPELYISALTGKGCHRIFPLVEQVFKRFDTRVSTSELNRWLIATVDAYSPPQKHHHPVKLNYATQTRVRPPTIAIWSNTPDGIKAPYRRYLENRLRETYDFEGTPIRLHIRQKRRPGEERGDD